MPQNPTIPNKSLATKAVIFGIGLGIADNIVITILNFLLVSLHGNYLQMGAHLLFVLSAMVILSLALRRIQGGYWPFLRAFGYIYLMLFCASMLVGLYTIALGKYIDPGYATRAKANIMAHTEFLLKKKGERGVELQASLREQEQILDRDFDPDLLGLIKRLSIEQITYILLSLILALLLKRQKPLYLIRDDISEKSRLK
jgi:hypothetical protein